MYQALAIAATGAEAAQLNLDVDAHNIANIQTPGYQHRIAIFTTLMYSDQQRAGSVNTASGTLLPAGIQVGNGVKPAAIIRSLKEGGLVQTQDPYHMAIQGRGYFQIEMPSGQTAYTRNGMFTVDANRNLTNLSGYNVVPAINVPLNATDVSISADGTVSASIANQKDKQTLGTIQLANFANEQGLDAVEDNLFLETAASGSPVINQAGQEGLGKVLQYWYEGSNEDAVVGVTNLIKNQRGYEMNIKTMKIAEEMARSLDRIGGA